MSKKRKTIPGAQDASASRALVPFLFCMCKFIQLPVLVEEEKKEGKKHTWGSAFRALLLLASSTSSYPVPVPYWCSVEGRWRGSIGESSLIAVGPSFMVWSISCRQLVVVRVVIVNLKLASELSEGPEGLISMTDNHHVIRSLK
jgi:hypothetical protein